MVAKIRLEAENSTGPAFQSVVDATNKVDAAGDSLNATLVELQARFDAARQSISRLEAAEKEAAAAGQSLGDSVQSVGAKSEGMKSPVKGAQSSVAGFAEAVFKLWALKETFTKVAQGIKYMAEQGNPAAMRLTHTVEDLQKALLKLGETEQSQYMLDGLVGAASTATEAFTEMSSGADTWASRMGSLLRGVQNRVSELATGLAESSGLIARGSLDEVVAEEKRREGRVRNHEKIMEMEHQRADVAKQLGEVEKINAEFRKVAAQEEAQQWASTFHTIEDVKTAQEEEIQTLSKMAADATATAEEQEEAKRRLTELEKRRQELTQSGLDKERRETERATSDRREARELEIEDAVAEHEKFLADEQEKERKNAEEISRAKEAAREKLLKSLEQKEAAHQEHIRKLQEAANLTDGKNGVAQGLKALGSKVTKDKAISKYVADREELAASGVRDSSEGMNPLELQKMIDWARREARKAAMRDVKTGAANSDLSQIQGEMATKVIDQAEASGKLGKNAAEALREAAKAAAKNRQELDTVNEELKQIKGWFSEFNKGSNNDRRRAERRR